MHSRILDQDFNGYIGREGSQRAVEVRFLGCEGDEGVERSYAATCFCRDIKGGECFHLDHLQLTELT